MPPSTVAQPHVINTAGTPPPRKLNVTVATMKDDSFQVLYIGPSHTEALAAADKFDEAEHKQIDVFRAPTAFRRFRAGSTGGMDPIIHHTPLKPGMTIDDLKAGRKGIPLRSDLRDALPQPEEHDDEIDGGEETLSKMRGQSKDKPENAGRPGTGKASESQAEELRAKVHAREGELKAFDDDKLKGEASRHGIPVEGYQPILDDEDREDLILDILEREFPEPPPVSPANPGALANQLKGLK